MAAVSSNIKHKSGLVFNLNNLNILSIAKISICDGIISNYKTANYLQNVHQPVGDTFLG